MSASPTPESKTPPSLVELLDALAAGATSDITALAPAALAAQGMVPGDRRLELYRWLTVGTTAIAAPASYADFRGSGEATAALEGIRADVARALRCVGLSIDDDDCGNAAVSEVCGLVEYICTKLQRPYSQDVLDVATPLLLCGKRAPAASDAEAVEDEVVRSLNLPLVFPVLYTVLERFTPSRSAAAFQRALDQLLRLTLQYHDPELSMFLDRQHADFSGPVLARWLPTAFASQVGSPDAVLALWDALFPMPDAPTLMPFLALQLLRHHRKEALSCEGAVGLGMFFQTARAPVTMDGSAFVEAAEALRRFTPFATRSLSARYLHAAPTFATEAEVQQAEHRLLSYVALPIETEELVASFSMGRPGGGPRPKHLNFVVLDCRAESSFHFARLPTALHVGSDIGFDPALLDRMSQRFESARGSHFCILGTGRGMAEEANLIKVILLHFVQCGFPYVGVAEGGFRALVPFIKQGRAEVVRTPQGEREKGTAKGKAATEATVAAPAGPLVSDETKQKIREKADVYGKKAAAAAATAKSWGWGALSKASASVSAWRGGKAEGQEAPAGHEQTQEEAQEQQAAVAREETQAGEAEPAEPKAPELFTLAEDEDDEDIVLITNVSRPQAPATAAEVTAPRAVAAESEPVAADPTPASEPAPVEQEEKAAESGPEAAVAVPAEEMSAPEPTQEVKPAEEAPKAEATEAEVPAKAEEPPTAAPAAASPSSPAPKKDTLFDSDDEIFGSPSPSAPAPAAPTAAAAKPSEAPSAAKSEEKHPFDDIFV